MANLGPSRDPMFMAYGTLKVPSTPIRAATIGTF